VAVAHEAIRRAAGGPPWSVVQRFTASTSAQKGHAEPPNPTQEYQFFGQKGVLGERCDALGEDVFAVAWAEGRAMTMEPAIEVALGAEVAASKVSGW
jgi:hypothetical protein